MQLVPPSARYRDGFFEAVEEFQAEGLAWWVGPAIDLAKTDFEAFVNLKLREATEGTDTRPPKTHLWAVLDDAFVGRLSIFHHLTDALFVSGGHIGYDTRPSFRGRGLATEMLRQTLPMAARLGLGRVLLTCDATNGASIRVIERNGGVPDPAHPAPSGKLAFWIDTPHR